MERLNVTLTAKSLYAAIGVWWRRAARLLPHDDWLVLGWVLLIRIWLFVFAAKCYRVLDNKNTVGTFGWADLWNRWDADQYLRLAKFGYTDARVWKAWLFPLYPWCVRFVAFITGTYLGAALLVSLFALAVAAILLRRLVQLDFSPQIALSSVWFFLIFPTAYFCHAPYTESLFIALVLGSIFAARRERWWLAGTLGALAWATRPTGIVLLPTLALEAATQFWQRRRWSWHWLWIGLLPVGFGTYLFLNWRVSGDPFAFLKMRDQLFHMSFSSPWRAMRGAFAIAREWKPDQAEMNGAQEFFFGALTLVAALLSWIKLRPSYAMWITGNWLVLVSVSFLISMPRYSLPLFPVFILFALLGQNRFWNAAITLWSLLFLSLFAALFVWGRWAF